MKPATILTAVSLALMGIALIVGVRKAEGHYQPGTHNAIHAIQLAWCGRANRVCWQGNEAIRVAKCEAAQYWEQGRPQEARNGQYRGMFQMGRSERTLYGHGPDPWSQAFAARRYFRASGSDWSPWDPLCRP